MKVRKQQITTFLNGKRLAIAGVSRDPKKFGHLVFKDLTKNGYTILPVNPNVESIDGVKCFKSVNDLPGDVESLLIMTPKPMTDNTLREAISKGIRNIWVQQMSETKDTLRIAEEYQREIISGKCIYMFAEPVSGFHKFHRAVMKIFGGLPK
jgi:predicted CoA-binding protein